MDTPLDNYPDLEGRKREFARLALKRPRDANLQAFRVFTGDKAAAIYASQHWPNDPEIRRLMDDLRAELGADAYLLSKDEMARELLDIAQDAKIEPKVRQTFYALYAQVQGHIAKDAIKVDVGGPVKELLAKVGEQGRPKPKGAD